MERPEPDLDMHNQKGKFRTVRYKSHARNESWNE
jgi:hypothetical protein